MSWCIFKKNCQYFPSIVIKLMGAGLQVFEIENQKSATSSEQLIAV